MQSKSKQAMVIITCSLSMLFLILDSKCAMLGVKEGIELCINAVIPALFPFCVLSIMLRSRITGRSTKLFQPIERFCGIPKGSGHLFLLGALGGYPIGAVCIEQARKQGYLTNADAGRMTCFCNNAGPSFIFGMLVGAFDGIDTVLLIWCIQLFSAIITGVILPGKSQNTIVPAHQQPVTFINALNEATRSMVNICANVVLFRMIVNILERWILWFVPEYISVILVGMLELTNGIVLLNLIQDPSMKFVIACALLSFGGICIIMQTASVSKNFALRFYLPGKLLQSMVSIVLAICVQIACKSTQYTLLFPVLLLSLLLAKLFMKCFNKKTVAFKSKMLYNKNIKDLRRISHAVSKKTP